MFKGILIVLMVISIGCETEQQKAFKSFSKELTFAIDAELARRNIRDKKQEDIETTYNIKETISNNKYLIKGLEYEFKTDYRTNESYSIVYEYAIYGLSKVGCSHTMLLVRQQKSSKCLDIQIISVNTESNRYKIVFKGSYYLNYTEYETSLEPMEYITEVYGGWEDLASIINRLGSLSQVIRATQSNY